MKKTLTVAAIAAGLLLTGCGPHVPSPAEDYTGPAKVVSTSNSGAKRGCYVKVQLPNGQFDSLGTGRRVSCNPWPAGKQVQISDGRLVR